MTAMIDRFDDALYTPAEAARYLGVPDSTIRTWARGATVRHVDRPPSALVPVITAFERPRGHASIPFVGLAEAYTLRAFREAGVPLQRIRPALSELDRELGLAHALASKSLYTDGAEVLYDFSTTSPDEEASAGARELVVVRNGQRVLHDVVAGYLQRVLYVDGYAQSLPLPGYGQADVVADAARGFGQPIFSRSAARVEDALSLFLTGEPLDVVSDEFGVPQLELQEVLRVAVQRAA